MSEILSKIEKWHAGSHFLGVLLLLSGAYPLVKESALAEVNWLVPSILIFLSSALAMYSFSTVYHLQKDLRMKYFWRKMDHISIYFLIAGTYTPFIVLFLHNQSGGRFLLIIWGLVIVGSIFKLYFVSKYNWLSLIFYLFLGWMVVFIYGPVTEHMSNLTMWWIIIGGAFYSVGTIFYAWKKLPANHLIWHALVLGGTFSHYLAIYYAIQNRII